MAATMRKRDKLKGLLSFQKGGRKGDSDRRDNALEASSVTIDSNTQQPTPDALSITANSNIEQQTPDTGSVAVNSTLQDVAPETTFATVDSHAQDDSPSHLVQSLWERAYDALAKENHELVKEYEKLLEKEEQIANNAANGESSTQSGSALQHAAYGSSSLSRQARLDAVIEHGLQRMEDATATYSIAGHEFDVQNQFSQAAKLLLWAKDWVATAVKASPEASLAWSGVCLVLPLVTNPATASEANHDGFVTVTSRMHYYTALEPMLRRLGDNPGVNESLISEATAHIVELYKAILDFQVSSVLRFFKSRLRKFLRDMISSKDWEKEVKHIKSLENTVNGDFGQINDLASRRELENLSKTCDEARLELRGIFSIATQQLDVLKEQLQLQKQAAQQQMTTDEKMCLQQFCLTKGENEATYHWYRDRVEDRVKGTCNWFLEHKNFQSWLAQDSGPLLVSADPGCGKSVLAKYLINDVLPLQSATICYFFFKDQDQDTVCQALCALLHQLLSQKSNLIQHAMGLFNSMGTALVHSESSLWAVLKSALQDPGAGSVILVLDALDECRESEFRSLVRNMQSLFPEEPVVHNKLKILVTSRPYEQIINEFWELLDAFPYIRIPGEEMSDELRKEINCVIEHRVGQLAKKHKLPKNIGRILKDRLLEIEHRTYLWVYLVFDHLDLGFKKVITGIDEALGNLPQTIDQAYNRILCRSKEDPSVNKALSIILAANQPLTLGEMNFAMTIRSPGQSLSDLNNELQGEDDFQQYLRSLCGLFVSVHHGKVYFIHQTAREFLLDSLLPSAPASNLKWHHSITVRQAHAVLAEICVFHLVQFNSIKIKELIGYDSDAEEAGFDTEESDSDENNYVERYKLLRYAAVNWVKHLREADIRNNLALDDLCLSLCDSKFQSHRVWCGIFHQQIMDIVANKKFVDLLVAACFGLDHVAQLLLDRGADIEAKDKYGRTPLLLAASSGHESSLKLLLDRGADVEARDRVGWTALLFAANSGHETSLKLLLDRGADIEAKNTNGWTALLCVSRYGRESSLKLLLDRCADVEARDRDGWTALLFAAINGYESSLRLLLDRGANIEAKNINGWTALLCVSRHGRESSLKLLLDKGADIEAKDKFGWTALLFAARHGRESRLKLLLDRSADVEAKDRDGWTALLFAANSGHETSLKLLLDRGADIEARDRDGWTALLFAANSGHESSLKLLLDRGADFEAKDRNGWKALLFAANSGHESSLKLLLDRGANIEAKDRNGRTALWHAENRNEDKIKQLLLGRGV